MLVYAPLPSLGCLGWSALLPQDSIVDPLGALPVWSSHVTRQPAPLCEGTQRLGLPSGDPFRASDSQPLRPTGPRARSRAVTSAARFQAGA